MAEGVERIELLGGNWWEFRTVVTRRMRKAFRRAAFGGLLAALGESNGHPVDLADAEAIRQAVMAHPDKVDLDVVDDAYLLHGTVAFSYAVQVTAEAIDGVAEEEVEIVLARMREFYQEMSGEKRQAFFETPSPPGK